LELFFLPKVKNYFFKVAKLGKKAELTKAEGGKTLFWWKYPWGFGV